LGAVSSRMFVIGIARTGRLVGLVRGSAGNELFVLFARGASCKSRLVGRSSFHMGRGKKERPFTATR
jgi:hypothetical protein